jgi:hypothetical protein
MTVPRPMLTPAVIVTLCPSHAPSPTVIVPPIAFSQHPEPNDVPAPIVTSRSPSSRSGGPRPTAAPKSSPEGCLLVTGSGNYELAALGPEGTSG